MSAIHVTNVEQWDIGLDIERTEKLNGVGYHEYVLATYDDLQYAASIAQGPQNLDNSHWANPGRRRMLSDMGKSKYLTFKDYEQTTVDSRK